MRASSWCFAALAAIFDSDTRRYLARIGIAGGWSCLEIGAGAGSIALWMAEAVTPDGRVVATDIDVRHLAVRAPNLEILRHDVAVDPLPPAAFDLIHARLVLMHLPDSGAVMARMTAALKPGGWLLVEDFEVAPGGAAVPLPTIAAMRRVMADAGMRLDCGRDHPARLRAAGLEQVAAERTEFVWRADSMAAVMTRATIEHLSDRMIAAGLVSAEQIARDLARVEDPATILPSPIMWSAWGRRPVVRPAPG